MHDGSDHFCREQTISSMGLALVCRGLYLDPGGGWAWSFAWKNCGCSCDILIMAAEFPRSFVGPLAEEHRVIIKTAKTGFLFSCFDILRTDNSKTNVGSQKLHNRVEEPRCWD